MTLTILSEFQLSFWISQFLRVSLIILFINVRSCKSGNWKYIQQQELAISKTDLESELEAAQLTSSLEILCNKQFF